jgi:hypothetical protein
MTTRTHAVPGAGQEDGPLPAVTAGVPGWPVRYCPSCGYDLHQPQGFIQEYWVAEDSSFLCWCPACLLLCTVTTPRRITSHEPEH